jgi:hypothetical protein
MPSREAKLATHQIDYRPRRYLSADDAAGVYVRARALMEGCPAIDYARPLVQSAPSKTNPHLDAADDVILLERVFLAAFAHRDVSRDRARVWVAVRLLCHPMKGLGVPRSTVRDWLRIVDGAVESEMYERGMMIRGSVRVMARAVDDEMRSA